MTTSGGKSNTRLTFQGMKEESNVGSTVLTVGNATIYNPVICYMGAGGQGSEQWTLNNSGSGSIIFSLDFATLTNQVFNTTGSVTTYTNGNTGTGTNVADTTWNSTSQGYVSNALDHLRLLRLLDNAISDPLPAETPIGSGTAVVDWGLGLGLGLGIG